MASGGFNKVFIFVVAVAFLLCIAALIVAIVLFVKVNNATPAPSAATLPVVSVSGGPLPPKPSTTMPPISNSSGWTAVANMFAQSIDMSVNPCTDFYQFSCGNWIRLHPIPAGQSSAISFGVLQNQIVKTITKQFNNAKNQSIPATNPSAVQKAQLVWNRCMHINMSNYNGSQVRGLLTGYGGFPMITPGWTKMKYSLGFLMGHFSALYGVDTFISQFTDTNWRNPNTGYLLFLDQAVLSLPLTYYTSPSTWKKYKPLLINYMMRVSGLLANETGTPLNQTQAMADTTAMVNMEFLIATTMAVPVANQRDATKQYNLYNFTAVNASNAWASVNWNDYFNQLGLNGAWNSRNLMMFSFSITEPSYMNNFTQWLPQATPRLLQNYMLWRLIQPQLEFLPGAYRDAYADYQSGVFGIDSLYTPADRCSINVLNSMGYAVSRLYVQNYWNTLPGNPRAALSSMIDAVKGAFGGMLNNLPWMDASTRVSAQAKIANLVKNVAYPNWMMNDTQLNNYYAPLHIHWQDDWMLMLNKVTMFQIYNSFLPLTQKLNRRNFNGAPAIVNAWYQPELNSITFPAGILNPPFFDPLYPRSVNYGGIGVVMGHELTHGFDDQGVQWNGTGFLNPWIDSSSMKGFHTMAQCVINEYSNFCYPPSYNLNPNCISGQRTQGENIADNGGIKAAWNAYQALNKKLGVQPRLPGMMSQFTHDQLFFMSFAQVWCRNIKPSSIQSQLLTDPHSPAKYRVWGTVENVPQFGKAFNCPANSPMTPANHCTVW